MDPHSELAAAVDAAYGAAGSGDLAGLSRAIEDLGRGIGRLADDDPNTGVYQAVLSFAFARRFRLSGRVDDLRAGIEIGERAAGAMATDDPQRHKVLYQLSLHYSELFKVTRRLSDLDNSIEFAEECLEISPADEPARAEKLFNLALSYSRRFEHAGEVGDRDSMIELWEEILDAPPVDTVRRDEVLAWLRNAYTDRFGRDGDPDDLDAAIEVGERCVAETPADDPDRVNRLLLLAVAHQQRFDVTEELVDADASIRHAEAGLAVADPADTLWPSLLALVAEGHHRRFSRTAAPADLDAAVEGLERVIAVLEPGDPQRARWLANVGMDHLSRFRLTGDPESLDAALDRLERAIAGVPEDHPDHAACLSSLASAYHARHEFTNDGDDLATSIELNERILARTPPEHHSHIVALVNLAVDYFQRYPRTGDPADLDTGIDTGERALPLLPPTGADRSSCLSNVAVGYRRRYERFGATADLDAAVDLGEQAVAALPEDHPQRPLRLGNLALAYAARFRRAGASADLDAAVDAGEQAVAELPLTHQDRGRAWLNLSTYYRVRFTVSDDPDDLDRSVERAEQALSTVADGEPGRAMIATALAGAHLFRYRHSAEEADLDAAVDHIERVAAATPPGAPMSMGLLSNLAVAYREVADRRPLPDGTVSRLTAAVSAAESTADVTETPVSRAITQYNVGLLAMHTGEKASAAAMLRAAVETLPQCAPRGLDWSDQEHQLAHSRGLLGEAIAAQLDVDDVAGALELAELGRGILLANQLDTRTSTAELEHVEPELATEFDRLRTELGLPRPADLDPGQAAAWLVRRRAAADEWNALLRRIRELPEFPDFLAPPHARDLRRAAESGTVVLVNVSQLGGAAILVRPDSITRLRLDDLTLNETRARVADLTGVITKGDRAWLTPPKPVDPELLAWLWEAVTGPVLDALGHLTPPAAGEAPPRLWWIPTGLLGLLPLHAAGLTGGPSALDQVVSSYTPTIRALLHSQRRAAAPGRTRLTVAMRHTTGMPDLPGTAAEAAHLRTRYPATVELANTTATVDAVLDALPRATFAHFACHASTHPVESARGGLHLHDAVLSVPEIGRLRLRDAELAYLSACSTGQSTQIVADEALHLGSAFQLAGYRHVVATLWPVGDTVAAKAARRFYDLLGDSPTADRAATVLHQVTRELRDEFPDAPRLWAPFIHSGP